MNNTKFLELIDELERANQRVGGSNPALVFDPARPIFIDRAKNARLRLIEFVQNEISRMEVEAPIRPDESKRLPGV